MSGFETLKKIRKKHMGMAIMALTGYTSSKTSVEAMLPAAESNRKKPFELNAFFGKISEAKSKHVLALQHKSKEEIVNILKIKSW